MKGETGKLPQEWSISAGPWEGYSWDSGWQQRRRMYGKSVRTRGGRKTPNILGKWWEFHLNRRVGWTGSALQEEAPLCLSFPNSSITLIMIGLYSCFTVSTSKGGASELKQLASNYFRLCRSYGHHHNYLALLGRHESHKQHTNMSVTGSQWNCTYRKRWRPEPAHRRDLADPALWRMSTCVLGT